ncbi:MAG TPA: glycosyl transferase, partial [Tardiphaga sp.]
ARSPWLMFLHAGAVLDPGWIEETSQFIQRVSSSDRPRAGIFRYARSPYADSSLRDGLRFLARMVTGPYADQGLLIAREHYDRLGGYADARRSEARLLRQLGRSSRTLLRSRIIVA